MKIEDSAEQQRFLQKCRNLTEKFLDNLRATTPQMTYRQYLVKLRKYTTTMVKGIENADADVVMAAVRDPMGKVLKAP